MEKFIHDQYTLKAIELVRKGQSFFITGKAGTGKTRLLGEIVRESRARGKNIAVAAPTGIAAKNAEGQTLHSLFGLKTITFIPGKTRNWYHLDTAKERIIRKLDILIIDEISMVRCDVLDMVDQTLKKVRWSGSAFGGIQVIFFGDLFQLPPVVEDEDEELLYSHYEQGNPYFFSSDIIRKHPLPLLELEKVHRQKDEKFVRILNNIREGKNLSSDIDAINRRYKADYEPSNSEPAVYLRTRKYNVWKHNDSKLKELPGEKFTSTAEIDGYFPKRLFPADEELALKVGAKVMLLRNDNDSYEYVNGTLGIVKSIYGGIVRVITEEGKLISVEKSAWTLYKYEYDERNKIIKPYPVGSFTQYPIKLAWAVTIHKSQGLTFDKVIIDAHRAFASGQVYVALSRCRSLKGIVLTSKISKNDIKLDPIIVDYMKSVEKIKPDLTLQNEELEDIFLYDDDGKTITGITSEFNGTVEIPEGVEKIADDAFKDNTGITEVICPESLREIGRNAFEGCVSLHKINLNEGLKRIGYKALNGTELKEVIIPSTVSYIAINAFDCRLRVNTNNDYYSDIDGVLYNKNSTRLMLYPRQITRKIIEIPDSVTAIEEYAFENNEAEKIIIPKDIKSLNECLFLGCENLRTLTIKAANPDSIYISELAIIGFEVESCILQVPFESLSEYMTDERFKGFKYITAIEGSRCLIYDEKGTEVIGCNEEDCEKVVIPEGVESIKENSFEGNETIESVILPNSLKRIGKMAFKGCINLYDVELNEYLEAIGYDAFKGTDLSHIHIPFMVEKIGVTAFDCEISVDEKNTDFCAHDGVLYSYDEDELLIYPADKIEDEFEVPSTIEKIGAFAFEDSCLKKLTLPDSIEHLDKYIFSNVTYLETLIMQVLDPDDITIDEEAFETFNKKQCKLIVPEGSTTLYASNNHFKDFKIISEVLDSEYVTGQYFEKLPGTYYTDGKTFFYFDGSNHCYVVMSSKGFFLKIINGGYYFMSNLIDDNKTGRIWIKNKRGTAISYSVAYTTDNEDYYPFGQFTESVLYKKISYKDKKTGKSFTIDITSDLV